MSVFHPCKRSVCGSCGERGWVFAHRPCCWLPPLRSLFSNLEPLYHAFPCFSPANGTIVTRKTRRKLDPLGSDAKRGYKGRSDNAPPTAQSGLASQWDKPIFRTSFRHFPISARNCRTTYRQYHERGRFGIFGASNLGNLDVGGSPGRWATATAPCLACSPIGSKTHDNYQIPYFNQV